MASPHAAWRSGRQVAASATAVLLWAAGVAGAQERYGGVGQGVFPVAVDSFIQTGGGSDLHYGALFADLVRVRLGEEPRLRLEPSAAAARCASASTQPTTALQSTANVGRAPAYAVSGHVDARPEGVRLEYGVSKCTAGGVVVLLPFVRFIPRGQVYTEFTVAVGLIARTIRRDLPRTGIAVTAFDAKGSPAEAVASFAFRATLDVVTSINESETMEVTDSAQADYSVEGRLELSRGQLEAHLLLVGPNMRRVPVPVVRGDSAAFRDFSGRLQSSALDWLSRLKSADALGTSVSSLQLQALLSAARAALCLPPSPGCRADLSEALAASHTATQVDSASGAAWHLLGKAELAQAAFVQAGRALAIADSLLPPETSRSTRTDVLNDLARARFGLRDYSAALESYRRSLVLDPAQRDVALAAAEVQWFRGERVAALGRLMELRTSGGAGDSVTVRIAEHVASLEPADLIEAPALIREACGIAQDLRTRCLQLVHRAGTELTDSVGEARRRRVFQLLLDLQPGDAAMRVDAYGYISASYLGISVDTVERIGNRDYSRSVYRGFQPDSVDRYLRLAEAEDTTALEPRVREWLLRLRALYYRNRSDFGRAWSWAEGNVRRYGGEYARMIASDVLYEWARGQERDSIRAGRPMADTTRALYEAASQRYRQAADDGFGWAYPGLREVYHSLGRDRQAAELLERYLRRDSSDVALVRSLKYLYNEYLFDYQRGYRLEVQLQSLLSRSSVMDSVDVAENALIVGDYEGGRRWLSTVPAWRGRLDACSQMVAEFFVVWTAIGLRDADARSAFEGWQSARSAHWSSETPRSCWVFDGVRNHLGRPSREFKGRSFLLQMLNAMDRGDASPPPWQTP